MSEQKEVYTPSTKAKDMPNNEFYLDKQVFSMPVYNKIFEKALREGLVRNKIPHHKVEVKDLPYYCYYSFTPHTTAILCSIFQHVGVAFYCAVNNSKE